MVGEMERRDYLKTVGATFLLTSLYPLNGAALSPVGGNVLFGHNVKSDYTGLPDRFHEDPGFGPELEQLYGDVSLDEDTEVLIDVIPVGDRTLEDSIEKEIEEIHGRNGIKAEVYEREDSFPENDFQEKYGSDAGKILGSHGSYSGFVEDEVSEGMQEAAIQVVLAPGEEEDMEGWLKHDGNYRGGFALGSQVIMSSDKAFKQRYGSRYREGKKLALMHEIGHSYGLRHSDDSSDVMYLDISLGSGPGYEDNDWEKVREKLS